ncbi:MAG: TonB family protein [Candidatus Binatia bacterium]
MGLKVPGGEMAPGAPDGRVFDPWRKDGRRRVGWAALVSAVTHAALGVLFAGVAIRTPMWAPPIRVFLLYDPAPPPSLASASPPARSDAGAEPVVRARSLARAAKRDHKMRRRRQLPPQPAHHAAPAAVAPVRAKRITGAHPGSAPGGVAGGTAGGTGHAVMLASRPSRLPIPISKVIPRYPAAARFHGIEGRVMLQAIVGADGRVEPGITVVHSVPLLDSAAIAALRQWRFRPARGPDGLPIRVTLQIPVRFVLQ